MKAPSEREIEAAARAIDNIYFAPGIPYGWAESAARKALTEAAKVRNDEQQAPEKG